MNPILPMSFTASSLLQDLVPATHTPFRNDGALDLGVVERLAAHLLAQGITAAFIGGTTGESHSLTLGERQALARRWTDVARGTALRIVVHVGSNSLEDACELARQAQELGATAISALAPSYFKPRTVAELVAVCARIAGAAPATPFYYYDIPSYTGVSLPMPEFLVAARERIPTLVGLKVSNPDLAAYQACLHAGGTAWDLPWGIDEALLAALAVGGRGAVGSSYNFAAPLYRRMLAAFASGDLAAARAEQWRSVQLIRVLARFGYLGASKAVMGMLGVEVGPARLPLTNPQPEQVTALRSELEAIGFFNWIEPARPGAGNPL